MMQLYFHMKSQVWVSHEEGAHIPKTLRFDQKSEVPVPIVRHPILAFLLVHKECLVGSLMEGMSYEGQ
eukprot:13641042-Ditylum_brightwellii.AAC.1